MPSTHCPYGLRTWPICTGLGSSLVIPSGGSCAVYSLAINPLSNFFAHMDDLHRPGIITGDTLWRRKHLAVKGYHVLPIRATEYMDISSSEARVRWV
eukprot:1160317-Pelagomonas_calceolata.AAC.19